MKRGPRLVILGKQGAGKGTQGLRLAKHFNTQHLSTGQLFRDSAEVGVDAGLKAKAFMDRGELVPDDIVVDGGRGAVLESRPRSSRGSCSTGSPAPPIRPASWTAS